MIPAAIWQTNYAQTVGYIFWDNNSIFFCLFCISGSAIRWRRSNGLGRNILHSFGVWFATNCWLGFGYWSVDYVIDWFTKYQGLFSFLSLSLTLQVSINLHVHFFWKYLIIFCPFGSRRFFSSLPWNLKMSCPN